MTDEPTIRGLLDVIAKQRDALEIATGYIAIRAFSGCNLCQKMKDDKLDPALALTEPLMKLLDKVVEL